MPEITCCPDCEKRLKVPDALIGKKVRCPGCAKMFVAKVAGKEEDEEIIEAEIEEETPPPAKKPVRSAAIAEKPSGGKVARRSRDLDDDEDGIVESPAPRRRSREEEDDEDEDKEKPRARRRYPEDDEGDEDEDEDKPKKKRRRYPEDDEDEEDEGRGRSRHAGGWSGTKTGINLTVIGGWGLLLAASLMVVVLGLGLIMGGGLLAGAANAAPGGGMMGQLFGGGILAILGMIGVVGVGGIAALLVVVGQCMCLQVPRLGGSSTGTMIVGCVVCFFASFVIGFLSGFLPPGGLLSIMLTLVCAALNFASFMFWLSFLGGVCTDLKDRGNAESVSSYRSWVFILIGASFGVGLLLGVILMIVPMAGLILAGIAYFALGISQLVMFIWLLFIQQAVRDTIIRRVKM